MAGSSILEKFLSGTTGDDIEKVIAEHKKAMRVWDIEDDVSLFIGVFSELAQTDQRCHARATKDRSYPYAERQASLEKAIGNVVRIVDKLLAVCREFVNLGYEIKGVDKLQALRDAFAETDKRFDELYESKELNDIHKKAVEEYKAGKTEEWPQG